VKFAVWWEAKNQPPAVRMMLPDGALTR
jgi:hypothetical protein